jgi:hypothetical protein
MKHFHFSLVTLLVSGLLFSATSTSQAQIVLNVTFALTVQTDNSQNATDNGTVKTIPPPSVQKIATKNILSLLAQDEFAAGNYGTNAFPTGAKLALVDNGSGSVKFVVVDISNNLIVDVSDLLTMGGSDGITSGKESDFNINSDGDGLAAPTKTDTGPIIMTYDDSSVSGGQNISFTIAGLHKGTTTDTTPNSVTGAYTEKQTHALTSLVGSGKDSDGNTMVITGTGTASGTAALSL